MIAGCWGRENTLLSNGKYIKDLSYLNRPIGEVVYIDFTDEVVEYHKDNCIKLRLFDGDVDDRELIDIIPFLERKLFFNFFSFFYRSCEIPWRCKVRN
jgi:TFIIF-interacting CTD phosphatase-like protein